ncbi:MAG: HepT-like ribonuclease domain-containing protein [Rickettsiales bacterium]
MKAFRNILVRDYLGDIDYERVWKAIDGRLPVLEEAARSLL